MKRATPMPSLSLLRRIVGRLGPHAKRQRWRFLWAFLGTIGVIAGELAEPWPLKIVFDSVLQHQPVHLLPDAWRPFFEAEENSLWLLLLAAASVLVIAVFTGICSFVRELFSAAAGQRVVMSVREEVHSHVQRLSSDFHVGARHGDLLMRLTGDLVLVRELLVDAILEIARTLLLIVGMAVVLVCMHPMLGLIALSVIPVLAFVQHWFQARIAVVSTEQRENEAKIAAHTGEMLAAMDLVHTYQLEEQLGEQFHARNRKSLKSGLRGTRLQARLSRSLEIALAGGVAVTLFLGARQVESHAMTAGSLLVLLSYVRNTYKPLRQLSQRAARVAKSAGAGSRILELLEVEPSVVEKAGALDLPAGPPSVDLDHVAVAYATPAGEPVEALRDVTFHVEPGRRVLLLGSNGAGKSTLLSLFPRLRDVAAGAVRLAGHDVRDLKLASLRGAIGLLAQEPALFSGSIADNIRLGDGDATDAEIADAARRAGLARAFGGEGDLGAILARKVGERGRRLSGGQRLRVALARLLLRRPRLVLLDEPEAALDAESRGRVLREILDALPEATVFIVAHHLSAHDLVDEAIVLDRGVVVDRGPLATIFERRPELLREPPATEEFAQ